MSGMTSANIITAARVNLREAAASVWADSDMTAWVAQVAREISRKNGLLKRANLAIVEYTKDIDLSSLSYIEILKVEYPVGNDPEQPILRSFDKFGSTLTLDISGVPEIDDDTLTGTITFTISSRSVTGSGTAFSTELAEGDLIGVSSGYKYYRVANIASDTALTLSEPFEETTVTDTVNTTKCRDYRSCARIYYSADYTVSTTSDMPAKYDEIAILGVVAHAATEFASDHAADKLADVTTKIGLANTQAGLATARLAQAATDLASGRTDFNTTQITTDMASAETALDQVGTDLTSARDLIDTLNEGGDVATKYIETAKADIEEAKIRIEKVKGYIDEPIPNINIATQEINVAVGYVNQALGYIQVADRDLNTFNLVAAYQRWANRKWDEYQKALNSIQQVKVHTFGVRAI